MSRFLDIQFDQDCLRLAAGGDRDAQRLLYGQLAGPMFALVRRMLRDRTAAEDVFQDSMIAVLRHLPAWRGEAPFGAWARQVTLNQCLAHLRSPWQKARRVLRDWAAPGDAAGFPSEVGTADAAWRTSQVVDPPLAELLDLERALDQLADTPRAVLWLHDVEGLTHAEIGASFDRSASFSKSQLARAHALLRAQLADQPDRVAPLLPTGITAQGQVP